MDARSTRRLRAGAGVIALALTSVAAMCGDARPERPAHLAHAAESPEALAEAILDRLAAADRAGLERLMLTRDEFEALVWPHLPVSRPATNMPISFVWNRLRQQSDGRLSQVLAVHGGTSYALVRLEFAGDRSRYGGATVARDSVMTVRTPAGGIERLELFGSMIEQDGRYKVFSFVTD